MIRRVGESLGRVVLDGIGRAASRVQERRSLPVDLLESDDAYLAVFDAAGARAGDVDVRFDEDTLTVRIDRLREDHPDYEMRFPGRGRRLEGSVTLPDDEVAAGAAEATLTGTGALEVLIPKDGADEAVTASDPVAADDGGADDATADA
jgi:HSP20 family molecular chaperone IbpA